MTKRKPTGKFGLSVGNVLAVAGVLLIVLSSLFFVTKQKTDTAYAATTDTLNFQGRLMSSGGNIVDDGVYNMQFSIYYQSSGGSAQWTEDRLVTNTQGVTIKNGYFSVNLGEYDTFGAIDWGNDLYLGMTVRGTGTCAWGACTPADSEMTPRLKLTSVPYAMKAGNVGSNNTNSASTNSNGVSITSGNALGATSNSGNISIDVGTATQTAGTISIGTANTSGITIGRTGVTTTNSGALTVTQAFAANGGATIVGATTINTTGTSNTQIGNATGTFQLDSSNIDISTAGAISGITSYSQASGNFVQSGAGTFSTGTGAVSLNGATTINGSQLTNTGATLNSAMTISDLPTGGNIGTAAATVDIKTTFNVNQTTAGQTLTLPNPTDTTSGRIVYINNVGSASFTMYGSVIASGKSNAFIWNGTAWVTSVSLSGSVVNAVGTLNSQSKSADGAVISSNAIYLQSADTSYAGLVDTTTQSFAGNKTFTDNLKATDYISFGNAVAGQCLYSALITCGSGEVVQFGSAYVNEQTNSSLYFGRLNEIEVTNNTANGLGTTFASSDYLEVNGSYDTGTSVGNSIFVGNAGSGDVGSLEGQQITILNAGAGTVAQAVGLTISVSGATTNTGIAVGGTGIDYGINLQTADTATLWLGSDADGTTSNAGIFFGQSRDTNLYRSAADTLMTDDSLQVGSDLGVTGTTTSSNLVVQGQSAFGPDAVLGGCAWLNCGASEVVNMSSAINSTNTADTVFGSLTETKISNASTRSNYGIGVSGNIILENSALNDAIINTGLYAGASYEGSANVGNIQGLVVSTSASGGSGTVTNAFGIQVASVGGATNNYGIALGATDTQTLWLDSFSDSTTANAGIGFGLSRDTNLYRSAANTLMTDDSFTVGTDLTVTGATTLNGNLTVGNATTDRITLTAQISGGSPIVLQGATDNGFTTTLAVTDPTANNIITLPNASGTVALVTSGSSTSGVSAFTQGGNTWAGTGTLGLVDSNTLNIITGNTTRLSISGTGSTTITGGTSGTALTVNNSTSTGNIFDFQENGTNVLSLLDSTNGGYLQFNSGADRVISVAQQTSSNTAGNILTVISGQGNGSGAGGTLIVGAGSGGPTGTGGATYVVGGTGGSTSGNGGSLNLQGGQTTSGAGGGIGILAAASTGANSGGAIAIQSGTGGATGTGGALTLQAGTGGASGASGGAVSITAGTGQGVATISFSVPGGVNGTTEVITTSSSHGLVTGDTVMYDDNGGGYIIGLAENKVYYVRNLSSTTLSLHPTSADASANTNAVNINTQAGGTQTDYLFKTNLGNGGSTTIAGGDANSYAAGGNIVFQTASSNASLTTVGYFNSVNGGLTLQNTIDGNEAFRILNSSGTAILTTDTSQVWRPTRDLPNETSESGAFIANGYAYVIGGMDNNDDLDTPLSTVYYATVNADGTLGSWSTTTALPAARAGHSVTYANGYVYVAGGANSTRPNALNEWRLQAGNNTVYYARVNADGTLGAWSTANSLPAARVNHSAETYNGYLYIVGGAAAGNGAPSRDVYYARINSDGSLGSWTTQSNWLNEGRMLHDSVVLNNQLYVVWGTDDYLTVPTTADGDNTLSHGVFNEDGSLGTVDQDSTSGVEPNILINAEVVNGKIYVYDGLYLSGATQLPQNLKVIFNLTSDGQFSSLSSTAPTPASTNLYARSSAQYNGTIYRFGGTGSLTQDLADIVALPGGNCVGSEIEVCGNNSVATVEYMATPKVNITGSLDLTSGGVAGNLRAGNTTIAGTLEVTSGAEFKDSVLIQNGLLVRGTSLLEGAVGFGTQTTAQSCASNCTITQSNVDNYSALTINATASSVVVSMPDPTVTTAGKVVYVTAVDGSNDFTLRINSGGTQIDISMRENTTATLIWNGSDWTAAGASSSTDLQAAYNNTLTSAGGAELVLNAAGGAADGLTIRNNSTTPITGALLEVQTSIGSNLLSVNNNSTEYSNNGGAETTTFTMWTAAPAGGTISRYTTVGNYVATGTASTSVVTGAVANHGVRNVLSTSLTANLKYSVSFAVRGTTNFSTLEVVYSRDGTNTSTTACASTQTVTTGKWSRIICTFTAPSSGITSSNAIFIRQTDATARTFYVDNLSVNVSADVNHAVDGSVDSALGTNWTNFGTLTGLTRDTSTIYDTSGAVNVDTAATADTGVRNNLSITPSTSTQYLVTFFAKSSNSFTDIRVRYSRDGGTNFVSCTDYNTQNVSTSTWTEVTCLFTTDSTTATNPDLIIDQPTATDRNFYIDALSITLNQNTANNVQVGGANKGGPTTLFTLDRSSTAPIAENNDNYLGSMYYDTTTGRIQCYEADGWGACGAAPDNYVNLNPEYAGAVLNGTGVGTMTADFCSNQAGVLQVNYSAATDPCYTSGDVKNYYRWTSPQATEQTYSIYVTYQLPATFRGFASDDTVQLSGRVDNTTNAAVTYQMYAKTAAGALSQCGTGETDVVTGGGGAANTWYSYGINGNESTGCSLTSSYANGFIIFKINMKANSNANAYVSTLSFTTNGQ
jgi:hypothetical protein